MDTDEITRRLNDRIPRNAEEMDFIELARFCVAENIQAAEKRLVNLRALLGIGRREAAAFRDWWVFSGFGD